MSVLVGSVLLLRCPMSVSPNRAVRVVVAVTTQRSSGRLPVLLRGLAEQIQASAQPGRFAVLVADESAEVVTARVTKQALAGVAGGVVGLRHTAPARVRNAQVGTVLRRFPAVEWLIFLSDDCHVRAGWLSAMDAALECSGDVVRGAVVSQLPARAARWDRLVVDDDMRGRWTWPSGIGMGLVNVAVRADVFRAKSGPWFDPQCGTAREVDESFVLSCRRAGATVTAVAGATIARRIVEPGINVSRAVQGVFTQARGQGRLECAQGGVLQGSGGVARSCGHVVRDLAAAVVHRDSDALVLAALASVRVVGGGVGVVEGLRQSHARTVPDKSSRVSGESVAGGASVVSLPLG